MKKTGITGIFIVMLIAVVLIAACTQEQAPGPDTIVIKLQVLWRICHADTRHTGTGGDKGHVDPERLFIGREYHRAIRKEPETPEQFNSIVKVFIDNNFASYEVPV